MRTEARAVTEVDPALQDHQPSGVPLSRYWVFGLLVVAGVAWDLASKAYVFETLGFPGRSEWEWRLDPLVRFALRTNLNFGALWGFGQGASGIFAAFSVVASIGVVYVLFVLKQARSWWLTIALGCVLAGALGNLYDRLGLPGLVDADQQTLYGVRDFLDFRFFDTFDWAIFNFADTYLVTGAIMLVIYSFRPEPGTTPHPGQVATAPPVSSAS